MDNNGSFQVSRRDYVKLLTFEILLDHLTQYVDENEGADQKRAMELLQYIDHKIEVGAEYLDCAYPVGE